MRFCSNCGFQLDSDAGEFCPNCGSKLFEKKQSKTPSERYSNNTKTEMLNNLNICQKFVNIIFSYISEANQIDNKIDDLNKKKSAAVSKLAFPLVLVSIIFSFFIAKLLTNISGVDSLFIIILLLLITFLPILIVALIIKKLNYNLQLQFKYEIYELEKQKTEIYKKIDRILDSPDGQFAKSIIPQDYFYPDAVSMFIFYIRNGQADTMKEALKEYDQYIHRCKLEYETNRMANAAEQTARASERTAAAAERSAIANESAANSARAVEQYSASTNFWTIYSTLHNVHEKKN